METGDVFVHKPYDAHSMITKVGYHRVRVWLGHKVLGRRAKTFYKTMTQLASGGECACLLDQLRGCLWRILFHWGQITISNVCNKETHFLIDFLIGVSRNLPHLKIKVTEGFPF